MKVVLQRVSSASVNVGNTLVSEIGRGYLLLVGIAKNDHFININKMVQKILKLRVFEDMNGKMNLSIVDIGGEILSVSQFTLLGSTNRGNRPGFDDAAIHEKALAMWEYFNSKLAEYVTVSTGVFAAHMEVSINNDGPVTFILDF